MIIDNELIAKAKETLGDEAALTIAKELQLDNFDENNLKGCCPFHKESTPSFIWNSKEHYYHCFGCGINYGIVDHYISFNRLSYINAVKKLFNTADIKYRFGEHELRQSKNYKYPSHEEHNRDAVNKYLAKRRISVETLNHCDVQADRFGNTVFHYYNENDVLMTVKYRWTGIPPAGKSKIWSAKHADSSPLLFNMNKINPNKPLVITEGEIDCLSIIEAGYKNCVSVPFGAGHEKWIEYNWDWLEQFEKIVIWSDNDAPGINMRKNVCARLGSWRTYYIDLPKVVKDKSVKDANDVLYKLGSKYILEFIDNACQAPIENVIDLFEVNDYDIESAEGIYTGFKEMDRHLYKIIFGTVSVWTGVNSSGKSVLVNQVGICESLNQGYDTFVFSGELPKPILKSWLERAMAGTEYISMINDHVRSIDQEKLTNIRRWYRRRLWVYDNDHDYSATSILDKMEEMARRHGVKVFIIDNMMMVDIGGTETTKYEKQTQFMKQLVNFANKYNVIVHLVAHPRKIEIGRKINKMDVSGTGDITNLAQYVFGIHRYTDKEHETNPPADNGYPYDCEVYLFKNRITGTQDKTVKVWFDKPSYRFYTSDEELYKRYKWNDDKSDITYKKDERIKLQTPY